MNHSNKDAVFAVDNDSAVRFLTDTTLFSDNRYAGLDLWENGSFIDYGARWAAFNDKHNLELFLGQTYDVNTSDEDFNDNGFRNGFSDYVGRISYSQRYFQIASRFRFDRKTSALNHTENSIYLGKSGNYISVGHIWDTQSIDNYSNTEQDTHEIIGAVGLRLSNRISVKESIIYNLYEHATQRHSGGIYYEHPCFYFSLGYQRDNAARLGYVGNTTYHFKFGISIDGKHY
jgi:lipopolysaccharide assembly outer membrane protein LptD (OstA)